MNRKRTETYTLTNGTTLPGATVAAFQIITSDALQALQAMPEASVDCIVTSPVHPVHTARQTKMGRPPKDGEFLQIVGNFSGVPLAREIMGTPWMGQYEMAQAIPPAYTTFIGWQLRAALMLTRAAS